MGRDEPGRLPTPASPRTRGAGLPRRTNPPAPTSPPSHPPRPRLLGETSGRAAVDIMRTPLDRHVLPLPSFGRTPARPVSAPTPHSRARRMYRRLPPPRAIRAGAHRATAAASLAADVGGRAGTPRRRQTRARVPRAPLSGGVPRGALPRPLPSYKILYPPSPSPVAPPGSSRRTRGAPQRTRRGGGPRPRRPHSAAVAFVAAPPIPYGRPPPLPIAMPPIPSPPLLSVLPNTQRTGATWSTVPAAAVHDSPAADPSPSPPERVS